MEHSEDSRRQPGLHSLFPESEKNIRLTASECECAWGHSTALSDELFFIPI